MLNDIDQADEYRATFEAWANDGTGWDPDRGVNSLGPPPDPRTFVLDALHERRRRRLMPAR